VAASCCGKAEPACASNRIGGSPAIDVSHPPRSLMYGFSAACSAAPGPMNTRTMSIMSSRPIDAARKERRDTPDGEAANR
jgi:hypothetical protein